MLCWLTGERERETEKVRENKRATTSLFSLRIIIPFLSLSPYGMAMGKENKETMWKLFFFFDDAVRAYTYVGMRGGRLFCQNLIFPMLTMVCTCSGLETE